MNYLSFDLDYFFIEPNYNASTNYYDVDKCLKFLDRISHIKNKILVDEHHHILNHINDSKCENILHVDYHQDLAFPYKKVINPYFDSVKLECGTFFYFVDDRENKTFKWFYPYYEDCIKNGKGLCVDTREKPLAPSNFIFKHQSTKCGLPSKKEIDTCSHLGIALSLDYLDSTNHDLELVVNKLTTIFGRDIVKPLLTNYEYNAEFNQIGKSL